MLDEYPNLIINEWLFSLYRNISTVKDCVLVSLYEWLLTSNDYCTVSSYWFLTRRDWLVTVGSYLVAVLLKKIRLLMLNFQLSLALFHDSLLIMLEFLVEPDYLQIVLVFSTQVQHFVQVTYLPENRMHKWFVTSFFKGIHISTIDKLTTLKNILRRLADLCARGLIHTSTYLVT